MPPVSTQEIASNALITNDATVLGLLIVILAFLFKTSESNHPFWKKLYTFFPVLTLAYFIPVSYTHLTLPTIYSV